MLHRLDDEGDEARVSELDRRQVDAHESVVGQWGARPRPGDGLAAGLLQDPSAKGNDRTGRFGDGNELGWREQAAARVAPPNKRLDSGQVAGVDVDDRLVVKLELALGDGSLEILARSRW